ncbi:MAG TPA: 7-cyano-7-deazaguanine synthase QueC [Planctomycetota bacterium]|nr:7-cyano-7-deazaguanine synthase QueC [Planctomycetota bacterium]
MTKPIAVVCLSGGLDSCMTASLAAETHEPALMHVNYGQRTEARELISFGRIADFFDADRRLVLNLNFLGIIGGSSLTDESRGVPEGDLGRRDIPSTYVPFRNANILSAAVSWAEVIGAQSVWMGAVEEDSSGYPDTCREFFEAFAKAVTLGTRPESHIEIVTPVIDLSKAQIVREGARLGTPFELTWSCYVDDEVACGECDSCLLRMRAFGEAGVTDPIPYRDSI